jgi:hypothetical protein
MPSSAIAAMMAYVLLPITNVDTPYAPSSSSKPPTPSLAAPTATGAVGSLTSTSWMPSSEYAAMMAYVLLPITNVDTPRG